MITCDLETNPSVLLSQWRNEIKSFCAQDFAASPSDDWQFAFQALLSRFRAWDFLMVQQTSGLRDLFAEADALCSHTAVPAEIKDKISEFVLWKIMVVTDLPENREFAEGFFEVRDSLPTQNQFRHLFVTRFIEREAYSSLLAPLYEVSSDIAPPEQSIPYIFEDALSSRIKELAGFYREIVS